MLFMIGGAAAVFALLLFFYLFFKRPHSLWLGFWALAALFSLFMMVLLFLFSFSSLDHSVLGPILPVLLLLFLLLMVFFALLLFVVPITSGIRLIKREGFSLSHLLSVAFGVLYFLYLTLWPILAVKSVLGNYLYSFFSGVIMYLAFIFLLFTISAFLNMFPHHRQTFDYIVVLGSGLIKGEAPPLLRSRLDKALSYAHEHRLASTFVFSGGQGADEPRPEAEAMAQYARERGLDVSRILKEDQSTSTLENIHFSNKMINNHWAQNQGEGTPKVLVVTTRYHVFRALLLAKKQGLYWEGLGAKTKFYFSLNAFLREYIAYLSLSKKSHLIIGGIMLFLRLLTTDVVQQWFAALLNR